jgi:hypothetical protein
MNRDLEKVIALVLAGAGLYFAWQRFQAALRAI